MDVSHDGRPDPGSVSSFPEIAAPFLVAESGHLTEAGRGLLSRSDHDDGARAVRVAVEAAVEARRADRRSRIFLLDAPTVGDVVGSRKDGQRCWVRRVFRSGGSFAGPCDNWTCAVCAPTKLLRLVGALLAVWGAAPVLVVEGSDRIARYREKHGVKLRGPNRTPGALLVEGTGGRRWLFVPDPRGLTGRALGEKLAEALLGKGVEFRVPREEEDDADRPLRTPTMVTAPPNTPDEEVEALVTWRIEKYGRAWRALERPTDDQWLAFVEGIRALWRRRDLLPLVA